MDFCKTWCAYNDRLESRDPTWKTAWPATFVGIMQHTRKNQKFKEKGARDIFSIFEVFLYFLQRNIEPLPLQSIINDFINKLLVFLGTYFDSR